MNHLKREYFSAAFSLFLLLTLVFNGFAINGLEEDGSILLPSQKAKFIAIHHEKQMQFSLSPQWTAFTQQNGRWSVFWNEKQGTPHRAFGKAIRIPGYNVIIAANIEDAARSFLTDHSSLLKINPTELKMRRATEVNNRWYVSFVQMKEGIEVLFSEVELRIYNNAKVMAFGSDFYPNINISTKPTIDYRTAQQKALQGLDFDSGKDKLFGKGRLCILPVDMGTETGYHLVYEVLVQIASPTGRYIMENYMVYVDAHSGEIIWRYNLVRSANVSGRVQGDVQLVTPFDPFVLKDFADAYVNIDGNQIVTDSLGNFSYTITLPATLATELRGPFINVNRDDGVPDASFTTTVNPGDSVTIHWDSGNSHDAERDAFYHANLVHNFVTTRDPNFTLINYSMPCAVNINSTCNAFWDGVGINFFIAGGGCPNTGQMPSVVYHEYGHGVNQLLYQQLGIPSGMVNGATHEGMADVLSAMIEDDSRIGRGFTGPGTHLRNLNNNNRYPDDISGESHNDGLIIGGAFWDLRLATSIETARYLSYYAMYGAPDDPNTGIAFSEWFLETMIADDDDGNLGNGTPHSNEIIDAFNQHGMGTGLYISLSFVHTPIADTQDTLNAYAIDFHLEGIGITGGNPDSLFVHYSLDGFQTVIDIPAVEVTLNEYHAEIPAQPLGSLVGYYITAFDPLGDTTVRFPMNGSYNFLVGFATVLLDEFETDSGWIIGAPDDNATTGIWERADPNATSLGSQPEDDHTINGTHCFVTDGRNQPGNPGAYDVDGGKTTLFSPILDLTALQDPVIQYYKWYSNNLGASPNQDYWKVDISNDGGDTWTSVENTNQSTSGWEKFQFIVNGYVTPTDSVQLRFVASDVDPGSLVEALIDDFELLAVGGVTGIDDDNITSNLPETFELKQNYPNPFNPTTTIQYTLPKNSRVLLKIHNTLGQEVRTLVNAFQAAGYKSVVWDGKNNRGELLSSGIYIYSIVAGDNAASKKLLFLK